MLILKQDESGYCEADMELMTVSMIRAMCWLDEQARVRMEASKEARKFYYDQKLVPAKLDVGDRVFRYHPAGKRGLVTKLLHHWLGPYIVTEGTDTNAWIRLVSKPFDKPKCVHLASLKKYTGSSVPPEDAQMDPSDDSDDGELADAAAPDTETTENVEPKDVEILNKDTTISLLPGEIPEDDEPDKQEDRNDGGGRYNLKRNRKMVKRDGLY